MPSYSYRSPEQAAADVAWAKVKQYSPNPIERNVALGILAGETARDAAARVTGLFNRDEDKLA